MAYDVPFESQRENFTFIEKARQLVYERVAHRLEETNNDYPFGPGDVIAYWFNKDNVNGNWTVRLSTKLPDSIYYQVTHDNATKRTSYDVYHKFDSQSFVDEETY